MGLNRESDISRNNFSIAEIQKERILAPIFVVGSPRSGTTLTGKIIGGHPQLFRVGETHFFEEVLPVSASLNEPIKDIELKGAVDRTYRNLGIHRFHQSQSLVEESFSQSDLYKFARSLGGSYKDLFLGFYEMVARSAGVQRIVDDTPRHIFHMHTILEIMPEAKFVGLVRDPRDFLASYKFMWNATAEAEVVRIRSLYHPILTSLYWRSGANSLLLHALDCCRDRIFLLRYEDLVQHSEQKIKEMIEFLGYEFHSGLLNVRSDNSSFDAGGRGIYSTSIGRWRKVLAPHETWIMQSVNRVFMKKLNYELEAVQPSFFRLVMACATAPLALARTFWTNRERRGSLMPYLYRRLRGMFQR